MSDNPCTFPCCGCTSNRACEMLTTATAKTGIVPSGQPLADTITQLRADLARVTGERDRLLTREAIGYVGNDIVVLQCRVCAGQRSVRRADYEAGRFDQPTPPTGG